MSTCIFPGRFQPFHTGHLMVVSGMVKSCANVVIAICHGERGKEDIFTLDEVREMISSALLAEDIVDATIVEIEDTMVDDDWVEALLEAAGNPEDFKVWTGDSAVKELMTSHDIAVQNISPVPGFNGEEIRQMIKTKNSEWRSKLPAGAMDVVFEKISK